MDVKKLPNKISMTDLEELEPYTEYCACFGLRNFVTQRMFNYVQVLERIASGCPRSQMVVSTMTVLVYLRYPLGKNFPPALKMRNETTKYSTVPIISGRGDNFELFE